MLLAIGDPFSFVILLASGLVCLVFNGWVTGLLAARAGTRGLREGGRTKPDPRRQLDPFGAVSALIAGYGWSSPTEVPRRSAGQVARIVLTGPFLLVLIGLGALAVQGAVQGPEFAVYADLVGPSNLLQDGGQDALAAGERAWLLAGLAATFTGLLHLVPLPPLPGGQVLFAAAPRTLGWQKAEYQLVERNIGIVVLLVLMLLPLGGSVALLPRLLDTIFGPLVRVVGGG